MNMSKGDLLRCRCVEGFLEQVDNVKRGRDEAVKRDLKEWNISKELAKDTCPWRLAINVPKP